jgi:hypothetical protein
MKKLFYNLKNDELTFPQVMLIAIAVMVISFGLIYIIDPSIITKY